MLPQPLNRSRENLIARIRMPFGGALLEPLMGLGDLERLWTRTLREEASGCIFDALLRTLKVRCTMEPSDADKIPSSGPVAIVANHPCGLLEGPAIASVVYQRRKDIRFLANSILATVPELRPYIIPVEIFGAKRDCEQNASALLAAYRWLRDGGVLIVFPAGEVSSVQFRDLKIIDRHWDDRLFRLFRSARATLVPVYVSGSNSVAFHIAGMINPTLRTVLLGRELLNKQNASISLDFGSPVRCGRLSSFGSDRAVSDYLRARTYLMHHRREAKHDVRGRRNGCAAVIPPASSDAIVREMRGLGEGRKLSSGGSLEVHLVEAADVPTTFEEITRLRELSFRAVGEGTGKAADRDEFDAHYQHLVLWDRQAGVIAGAYRMVRVDQALKRGGPGALYTNTLFHLKPAFLERVTNGIELGRSFVRLEYQRDFQPLYLLWKAIAAFVARHPAYRYLMGPVSISSDYSRTARELITHFCAAHFAGSDAVQPRHRMRPALITDREISRLGQLIGEADELSEIVSDIEPDRKPLPVLFRQYLALGGEVLGFNVDPAFSGTLDGLVLIDLMATRPAVLGRYMGKEKAAAYRIFHQK